MNRQLTSIRVVLTYVLCGVITVQPVMAKVVVANGSSNTSTSSALNGVEVINIATPNGKGLSHNKYQQFDVDPSGLILNNSIESAARSQLGGVLHGNANLNGNAASVILNEVTGANRSQLQGYTEVFGNQANVILTNPYGITCNGCGFINTPRVTLSTGIPQLNNGEVSGFNVSQGAVSIEGLGLDATRQTYFDIISRTAEINADIHANDLAIVTGQNDVEYQSNLVTAKTTSDLVKPILAIDSSSLGGMYAGRISLVATEEGVGVNVGNLSASQGGISISADGQVVLGSASSSENLAVRSQQALTLTGRQTANSNVSLAATQVSADKTQVVAAQTLAVEAENLTLSESTLESNQLDTDVETISLDQPSKITTRLAQLSNLTTLDNQGQLSASEQLAIQAANTELKGAGVINAAILSTQTDTLTLDTTLRTVSSTLDASQQLTLTEQGQLSATQGMNISGEALQLDGTLTSAGDVTVSANNAAVITGSVSADTATLNAKQLEQHGEVKTAQSLNVNTTQRFEQGANGVLESGTLLNIEANQLSLGGRSQSNDATIINAAQANLSGEHQAVNTLTVSSDTLDQAAQLSANQTVTLTATEQLTNTGNINAGQTLSITAQTLDNDAQLGAQQDVQLTLGDRLLNQSNGLISGQNTQVIAANIDNAGSLQALENLGFNAKALNNTGALVAGTDLITDIATTFDNHGVLYAANNANLYSQQLNNYGDIIASNNITIAKNESLEKSDGLLNSSATIESLGGDIGVYADSVENKRSVLETLDRVLKHQGSYVPSNFTVYHRQSSNSFQSIVNSGSLGAPVTTDNGRLSGYFYSIDFRDYSFSLPVVTESKEVVEATKASTIAANKDIVVQSKNVSNQSSLIAAENITILSDKVENIGYQSDSYTTYFKFTGSPYSAMQLGWLLVVEMVGFTKVKDHQDTSFLSSIVASNTLKLDVRDQINNSTIKSDAAKTIPASSTHELRGFDHSTVSDTISVPDLNGIPFPDFRFPSSPNGLFIYSDGPSSKYLIETNPLLSDMGQYLGSDYFQQSVGFNPESDVTFLGDAFYDTRVITQAIYEQTGQRYLGEGVGSDLSQMQKLIEGAAQQKEQLDLEAGGALSQEQIARLTDDIIWYEPVLIDGREVLAPKLYIANLSERDFTSGAVIAGKNIAIDAGNIENSGSIKAEEGLALTSEDQILNDTGSLQAGGDLIAEAKGNIENLSGSIVGDNVALVSHEGDIVNKTLSYELNIDKDGNWLESDANASFTETFIGDTATISANKELVLKAGNSIESKGATVKSGDDTTLIAGQDIRSTSIQDNNYLTYELRNATIEKAKTEYQDSLIRSGGTLNVLAGGDLEASGGELSASENTNIEVSGDITLLANQTYELDRYDAARKKDVSKSTRQNGVKLNAGQNLSIRSGNNVTLVASELNAINDISLTNSGQLVAMSANETDYSRVYRESRGFWGKSTSDTEISTQTSKGTSFNAENITLVSGDTQLHQASVLSANNDIHLESARGLLVFKAAQESESYRHETKKSGFKIKMQGQGHTSTSQKQTSMESGGNISLASALGMEVDYVSTDNNLAKALAQIPADGEFAWIAELKDNPNVNWNEVNEAFDSWSYSESSLSGPAAAIIAIALTVVTAGAAAGAGAALASATVGTTSAAASTVAAMGAAATSTLITQASLSLINNNGDLGATLDDLGSSAKVKQLATAMVTAGALSAFSVATGVTDGTINPDTGLANASSVDVAKLGADNPNIFTATPSFTPESLLRHVGKSSIRAGVDSTINGTDFSESFTNSLRGAIANDIGALAANEIGDISSSYGFKNGGFTKTTLHAISQGAVAELAGGDFEAGAAAGAAVELTGELIGEIEDQNTQVDVAGLVGATAGVIATGDAEGAYTGQNTGSNVHKNNFIEHMSKFENIALDQEATKDIEAFSEELDQRVIENAKTREAFINYISIVGGLATCGQGGCIAASIAISDLGEVLTRNVSDNNVSYDLVQSALIGAMPSTIPDDIRKDTTDLLLGLYGMKDIGKMSFNGSKYDNAISVINKIAEAGTAQIFEENLIGFIERRNE